MIFKKWEVARLFGRIPSKVTRESFFHFFCKFYKNRYIIRTCLPSCFFGQTPNSVVSHCSKFPCGLGPAFVESDPMYMEVELRGSKDMWLHRVFQQCNGCAYFQFIVVMKKLKLVWTRNKITQASHIIYCAVKRSCNKKAWRYKNNGSEISVIKSLHNMYTEQKI